MQECVFMCLMSLKCGFSVWSIQIELKNNVLQILNNNFIADLFQNLTSPLKSKGKIPSSSSTYSR